MLELFSKYNTQVRVDKHTHTLQLYYTVNDIVTR